MPVMRRAGNVYLVGLMGAGKTTVGRMLARRLKLRFLDSDQEIERRCGVRVPVIFEIEGEGGFRARETQVIAELAALQGIVLATGGGVGIAEPHRRLLAEHRAGMLLCAQPLDLYEPVPHGRNPPRPPTAYPLTPQ